MAVHLYPKGIINLMNGLIDMTNDTIKVALVDTGTYTYSANHEFYSDITGVVGTPTALAGKTVGVVGTGVLDAQDTVIPNVTGNSAEAVVLYTDGATKYLIGYAEFDPPVQPNGGNITLVWNAGGILTIGGG